MIDHEVQKQILSLSSFHKDGAKYSQLKPQDDNLDNDLYNYHLQYLVKNNYLKKDAGLYKLTPKGKSLVTNIDHASIKFANKYKVSVYLSPVVDGKILLYKRLKHPQYGYTGLISGKITYGEKILETAAREFTEETGLTADFKVIGSMRQIRKNAEGKVIEDGIFYVCFTDKVSGELIEKNLEGEYFWVDLNEVGNLEKIFKPSLEILIDEIIARVAGKAAWENYFLYEIEPPVEDY